METEVARIIIVTRAACDSFVRKGGSIVYVSGVVEDYREEEGALCLFVNAISMARAPSGSEEKWPSWKKDLKKGVRRKVVRKSKP